MCWQCDHPEVPQQEYLRLLREKVVEKGWLVMRIEDRAKSFSYTVGLTDHGLPELLITGLPQQMSQQLLDHVARYMQRKRVPAAGDTMTLPDGWCAEFVQVSEPRTHLAMAVGVCGPQVWALQVVWLDRDGHSPWSPFFNHGGTRQPVLGIRVRRRSSA